MKLNLPDRGNKFWFTIWGTLLLLCHGIGIVVRASYTDFNAHPDELARLPYLYYAANHTDIALIGKDVPEADFLDIDGLIEETPVIIRAVFEGDRTYVYQSFISELRVNEVIRGDSISTGQPITVFEPVRITRLPWFESWRQESPDSFTAFSNHFGLQGNGAPYVAQPTGSSYLYGGTMMKEGQEYLLFLRPKTYPSAEDRTGKHQEYVMVNNPYARLPIPATSSFVGPVTEVAVLDPSHDFITLRESQDCEIILGDAIDVGLYMQTRNVLLERMEIASSKTA
ncbi:MAG: hypothetical protein LBU07_05585 [Coriobacteriales bacterium]|jgi:hypothetical protein|nr:hypothetical protein [Coriobacteriales bacterium]